MLSRLADLLNLFFKHVLASLSEANSAVGLFVIILRCCEVNISEARIIHIQNIEIRPDSSKQRQPISDTKCRPIREKKANSILKGP